MDTKPTSYTVYADGRIVVTSGNTGGSAGYSEEVKISDAQLQEIIDCVNANRVWEIGDISDNHVLDGGYSHIRLFDAEGNEVYECGGYAPNGLSLKGMRYSEVVAVIAEKVPREILVRVEFEADRLLMEMYD